MQGVGAVRSGRIWRPAVYVASCDVDVAIDGAIVGTIDGDSGSGRSGLLRSLVFACEILTHCRCSYKSMALIIDLRRELVRLGGVPRIRHGDGLQVQNRVSKVDTRYVRMIVERKEKEGKKNKILTSFV